MPARKTDMPIRFRCAYCQQLMGIGRRKVGAIVRCPRCAGEVIVPDGLDMPAGGAGPFNDLLESEDFGKELAAEPIPLPVPHRPMAPPHIPAPIALTDAPPRTESHDPSIVCNVQRSGLFVPTPMLLAAVALLIACLAVTFGLGFVSSRWIGP
jgi:hypothetical protein